MGEREQLIVNRRTATRNLNKKLLDIFRSQGKKLRVDTATVNQITMIDVKLVLDTFINKDV